MRKRSNGLPVAVSLAIVAAVALPVWAFSPHLDEITHRYRRSFACEVCHDGTKLNRFGEDFRFALKLEGDAQKALELIDLLDSDYDGFSNGEELASGSYPGNKASLPREGAPPPQPSPSPSAP